MCINGRRIGDRDRMIKLLKLLTLIFIFICNVIGFVMLSHLVHVRTFQKALKITGLFLSLTIVSSLYAAKKIEFLILIAIGFLLFAVGSSLIGRSAYAED